MNGFKTYLLTTLVGGMGLGWDSSKITSHLPGHLLIYWWFGGGNSPKFWGGIAVLNGFKLYIIFPCHVGMWNDHPSGFGWDSLKELQILPTWMSRWKLGSKVRISGLLYPQFIPHLQGSVIPTPLILTNH